MKNEKLVKFVPAQIVHNEKSAKFQDRSLRDFLSRRSSELWSFPEVYGVLEALDEMEKSGGPGAYVSMTLSPETVKKILELHTFAFQDVGNLLRREVSRRSMPLKVKQRGTTFYMVWSGGAEASTGGG